MRYVSVLPTRTLETLLPQTIKLIADKIRKDRRHKGLIKAVECLAREPLEKLDFGALFSGVRLYGDVNRNCKLALRWCVRKMENLTHLNLSSKCDDAILLELAKRCQNEYLPRKDDVDTFKNLKILNSIFKSSFVQIESNIRSRWV